VKTGDLVEPKKGGRIGIIVEIFDDLDAENPWIRVHWTHPFSSYEWCKLQNLKHCSKPNPSG
jgi:hypothetical protein